jgi:SAM-dependent methyltransferase
MLEVTQFGSDYANAYDAIYRSKDYDGEVDLIERILVADGLVGPRRVLDLGCGTGAHALRLAQRGHLVVGIDRSPAMLAQARAKALAACNKSVEFYEADIRHLNLGQQFDAVVMMFTVLGYQVNDADLTATLSSVRRHLRPGGLFLFDVWHGPAVLAVNPDERQITISCGSGQISRKSRSILDVSRNLCRVTFDLERIEDGRIERWQEEHVVRYFYLQELELALARQQLQLLRFRAFPDAEAPADERAWNVIGIARAEEQGWASAG